MRTQRKIALALIGLMCLLVAASAYGMGVRYEAPGLGLGVGLFLLAVGAAHVAGFPILGFIESYFIFAQEQSDYYHALRLKQAMAATGGELPVAKPMTEAQRRRVNYHAYIVMFMLGVLAVVALIAFGAMALATGPFAISLIAIIAVPVSSGFNWVSARLPRPGEMRRQEEDVRRVMETHAPRQTSWRDAAHRESGKFDPDVESLIAARDYSGAQAVATERRHLARMAADDQRSGMYDRYLQVLERMGAEA